MLFSGKIRLLAKITVLSAVMAAIFVVDTTTSYEVAAAVFYTVVVLTASRIFPKRALMALSAVCIALTMSSFALTPHGNYEAGVINLGIAIASIVMITYVVLMMEASRTEAHVAQAQLMRISRVKSLEGLTTSIAHEVNQPLAAIVISGNACQRWLAQQPPNIHKASHALDRILADAGRASSIIVRVRNLTRGEPPRINEFDIAAAVREIIELSQAELDRYGISLVMNLAPSLPLASADRVQIQQVLGNLLLNAVEALAVTAQLDRSIKIASRQQGNAILVSVEDSGVGIASGMHDHLFDAFWTTKEEGIGVGLSISRAIVESNGGRIWADNDRRIGALFYFTVPIIGKRGSQ